jgi:hypothetical protein
MKMKRNFANFNRDSVVRSGKTDGSKFGVPMRSARYPPGTFWPLLPLAFIVFGLT